MGFPVSSYCRPVLPAALLLLAASAIAAPATTPLTLPSGRVLEVEVMVSNQDRAMGLMFRRSLGTDRGALLVFERADFHGIWMKNCRFPIDIIWIDEDKRIVHVAEDVPPCREDPCPVYEPLRRALYVLEINAGQAQADGAVVGATLSFEPPPR
jgi:uncharacterized membrane protein (UPF0127 family)